jgi:aspartate carbamoyltransferase catalytic subunit
MRGAALLNASRLMLQRSPVLYRQRHLLASEGLEPPAISQLLDIAESDVLLNRSGNIQPAGVRDATGDEIARCCAASR